MLKNFKQKYFYHKSPHLYKDRYRNKFNIEHFLRLIKPIETTH